MNFEKLFWKKFNKKCFLPFFVFFIFSNLLNAQTSITFSSKIKATNKALSITNASSVFSPFADFSAAMQMQKKSKIKTASFIIKPFPNFQIAFGNLSFSGAGKTAQNPILSQPAAISGFTIPQKGFAISLSGASTSENTPFSNAILAKYNGFTFYFGCKFIEKNNNNIEENNDFVSDFFPWEKNIFVNIGNNIKNAQNNFFQNGGNILTIKDFDTNYFAGIDFTPPKSRMFFSIQAGNFMMQNKNSTRWWLTTPAFVPQKINFTVTQFFYTGEKLKLFLNGGASTNPYGNLRFFTSDRIQLNSKKMQCEIGVFLCQKDFVTSNAEFIKKTKLFYFHPQTKPVKLPNGLGKITFGSTFSFVNNFKTERNAKENWNANYNFALLYQKDKLKIKPSLKIQNAFTNEAGLQNKAGGQTKAVFNNAKENAQNIERFFLNAFNFNEQTQFEQNIDFSFSKNIFEKEQNFSISANYVFFPFDKNGNFYQKISGAKNNPNADFFINAQNAQTNSNKEQFTISAKAYLKIGNNLSFGFSNGINFKQNNKEFFLYSLKTGANAKFFVNKEKYNFAFSLGFSHNQNLQKSSSSSTIFNYGVTFRIKP